MPLPRDRESLLSLAVETEHVLKETANSDEDNVVRRRAFSLRRLAVISWKLGELQEATRLFDEAAIAYSRLDSPLDRETAAAARIEQSTVVMADGNSEEALKIIERLIDQSGGFPDFENLSTMRSSGLEGWLILLEERKDYEGLYTAAGTAIELLYPDDPTTDQYVLAKAVARRAKAADALGYGDEAVELYEQAIALLEAQDPSVADGQLADAIYRHALLLTTLGRENELTIAFERLVARFGTGTDPWARQLVDVARSWLEEHKE
jgi:tetratricopeptide (TPR) repeat protein